MNQTQPSLTADQQDHVDKVFPECRVEMAQYLAAGADVVIGLQNEVGEAPPYAITVKGTNFWVDCFRTVADAAAAARRLGLKVVANVMVEGPGEVYRAENGFTAQREDGLTPNGNPIGKRWVLRDPSGAWVDFNQYRHDLFEHHGLRPAY